MTRFIRIFIVYSTSSILGVASATTISPSSPPTDLQGFIGWLPPYSTYTTPEPVACGPEYELVLTASAFACCYTGIGDCQVPTRCENATLYYAGGHSPTACYEYIHDTSGADVYCWTGTLFPRSPGDTASMTLSFDCNEKGMGILDNYTLYKVLDAPTTSNLPSASSTSHLLASPAMTSSLPAPSTTVVPGSSSTDEKTTVIEAVVGSVLGFLLLAGLVKFAMKRRRTSGITKADGDINELPVEESEALPKSTAEIAGNPISEMPSNTRALELDSYSLVELQA